ncbi:proteinase inhibitor I36 SMPI [Streptomyces sp. NBC_01275]|uniref:proteinase inhibitor I36 SMPI n=1 Tax=Streptomyces sp. NBC_01275 TaxID=2903807 RepID=UPI00225193BE|nr:proteinase inhibitor I36 SMPI [Streptomyces sp. NBC_01275]MCX4767952.1 proteinase inhibitor I36 SMPI [Streptomyces sp. NBC_01275]
MRFWRKSSAALLASVALVAGGTVATATPASAAIGGCAQGNLCLYAGTQFNVPKLTTGKTYECFQLAHYQLDGPYHIYSYVNNSPVKADLYAGTSTLDVFSYVGTIGSGKFSSNTQQNFNEVDVVCTGGREAYWSQA